ncbi:hypothetical protein BGX28_000836 [Mortierella sp. GBA30]|nr:hypothetical protein BGX28_000836 [Mortierella sp. GBA30]
MSERRRVSSIFGPLSPHYLMDEQHIPHPHQPHIDVQYRRRCKSISALGSGRYHANDNSSNNTNSNGHRDDDGENPDNRSNKRNAASHHLSLISPPASQNPSSTTFSPFTLESDEFGPDLFHFHSAPDTGSGLKRTSSLAEFQQQLFRQQAGGHPFQLIMPLSTTISCLQSMESNRDCEGSGPEALTLDLPPPHPNPRPSISPMSKNPLSPASSRGATPAQTQIQTHSPSRWQNRSPLSRVRSPLRNSSSNYNIQINNGTKMQPNYQQQTIFAPTTVNSTKRLFPLSDSLSDNQALGLRIQRPKTPMNDQENARMGFSRTREEEMNMAESPMSVDMIPNDQDQWRSPTLSALASQTSSRGPSSPWMETSSAGVFAAPRMKSSGRQHHRHLASQQQVDMAVEISLIEAHDEIPLQDIWRMEDEERKDRLNGENEEGASLEPSVALSNGRTVEEHIAHMKGEQHAREEARLIQEVLRADHG